MLDIILIQHVSTGFNLVEYRQKGTKLHEEHSDIFSGFLNAIQKVSKEINIGKVNLISTEGNKGHNCVIINEKIINVILLVDREDSLDFWRAQGERIGRKFINEYTENFNPSYSNQFDSFIPILKDICLLNPYCE